MDANFWHLKWKNNQIGFHASRPNPKLVAHYSALDLKPTNKIFLPLCGKSLDIGWFLSQGYRVSGIELSELAIEQLFAELGVVPSISQEGSLKHFAADNLDIFVGDVFNLDKKLLGNVDAIYDRAALVALPEDMRARYTEHLVSITNAAPQLLLTFEYDQSLMPGPPFSVTPGKVNRYYAGHYSVRLLERAEVEGGLKGKCPATESAWLLARQ